MLVAEVGEPPEVAKSNGEAEAGEEEVALVAPGTPLCLLLVLRVPSPSISFTRPHVLSCDMSQTLGVRLLTEEFGHLSLFKGGVKATFLLFSEEHIHLCFSFFVEMPAVCDISYLFRRFL